MSSKNFQNDNFKYTKNRTDIYNPAFNNFIKADDNKVNSFINNLDKWVEFISWARWFPDLWYDLITPQTGGIRLDLDQRVFLRSVARFISTYGVFPRGYGKTMKEVMAMYHSAIFFPDIEIAMSAQTKENASAILEDKHRELIKFYPLLANEIIKASFPKDTAEVLFTSGGRVDILANHQSSKGQRRKRLNIEEAALLNNALFKDVLEPIPNVPRRTIGEGCLISPEEMNGQINFFTTSGFRGTDEWVRSISMVKEMIELKGKMVLGSDWQLAVHYGRGETKSQILAKRDDPTTSAISFAQNYESKWVGATDNALININKVMDLRVLTKPELKGDGKSDYIVSMDVARSANEANNASSIAILKIKRNKKGQVLQIHLVNLINLETGLTFNAQTIELKKIKILYGAKMVVVDGNTMGSGIIDECLKESFDPNTGESLGCWNTINTEQEPELEDAEEILFDLHSQGINSDIIITFIDVIESRKLQLLEKKQDNNYEINDKDYYKNVMLPHIQTDLFLEEISNLKLKQLGSGKFTVEQVTKRINKDRYSAVAYGCYFIKMYEDNIEKDRNINLSQYVFYN